jgi:hypothetical protein
MKADQPVRVAVTHGGRRTTDRVNVGFADLDDALTFLHLQARAATAAGHTSLAAEILRDGAVVAHVAVAACSDLVGAVRTELSNHFGDAGLVRMTVPGIDAIIYAHRSCHGEDVLFIGVDANEDQRILFAVNDADLVDTTVGLRTGTLNLPGTPTAKMSVTATVDADTPAAAFRIFESAACAQPIHFSVQSNA